MKSKSDERGEEKTLGLPAIKQQALQERVWVAGIRRQNQTRSAFNASIQELKQLVDTAGGHVVGETFQEIDPPNTRTFVGSGKAEEILRTLKEHQVHTVVIDDEISPTQNRNLETMWGVKVLDRTALILDIFAKRAHTKEGRLQVELAQLQYLQPRLRGMWTHFSKQTGGIGTRGPGETQLEIDRRCVKDRIAKLKESLEQVKTHRQIHRNKREAVPLPIFSLVGYTNAGKSTLFNMLTNSGVLVEDKLFATLDPTVRSVRLPGGRQVLLADTVGFIKKLPHSLVESFKATFEEIAYSDGIIQVIDASDPECHAHIETVEKVLEEMGLSHKPRITVFNKIDADSVYMRNYHGIRLSARTGEGGLALVETIEATLRQHCRQVGLLLPHSRGDILGTLYKMGHVLSVDHTPEGIHVLCEIGEKFLNRYREYLID